MREKCLSLLVALIGLVSVAWSANQPWSTKPPGGIPVDKAPQFVVIGFDDNSDTEAMNWILDFMKDLKNPSGSGNAATFDGLPVRTSFYTNGNYLDGDASLRTVHLRAYTEGHEIGNHTYSHPHGEDVVGVQGWVDEIDKCSKSIVAAGIPQSAITGFRTPFLEYNGNTHKAIKQAGLRYDCTIEDGYSSSISEYPWPYTLDEGAWKVDPVPGLWVLPNCPLDKPSGGKVTGFDYNMWAPSSQGGQAMNKADFLKTLKDGLDKRLAGNRNPFMFGAHTQFYVDEYSKNTPNATTAERRAAIEEFITYALSFDDVRFVAADQILDWCEDPVALGLNPDKFTLQISALNGEVTTDPDSEEFDKGAEVTLTATAKDGFEFSGWSGDLSGKENPTTITMDGNKAVNALFTAKEDTSMINLVSRFGWSVGYDTTTYDGGSKCGGSTSEISGGISATLTRATRIDTKQEWPWVTLSGSEGIRLTGSNQLKISYDSDTELSLSLPQEGLGGGANWAITLPAADTTLVVTIDENTFSQPSWVSEKTPLDLSKVEGINIEIATSDYSKEITAQLDISYLGLGNYEGNTVGVVHKTTNSNKHYGFTASLHEDRLSLKTEKSGVYSVVLYSINGRVLREFHNQNLTDGVHTFAMEPLSQGVYLLKVKDSQNKVNTAIIKQ